MDKYCIVPKTSRILFDLARGMEMNHDEEVLLKGGFIRHVEISLDTNTWEILAWTMPQIAESLLERVASFVEEKNQVAKVLIYQTAMKLDKIVEQNWEKLVDYVAKENQGVRHILLHSNRIYKESKILLQVNGDFSKYLLEEHNILQDLKEAGIKVIGYPIKLECLPVYEEIEVPDVEEAVQETKEYQAALEAAKAPAPKPAQGGGGYGGNYGGAPAGGGEKSPSSKPSRPRRAAIPIGDDDSPLVYGEAIIGEITPISEIEGEMKNVVAQGTIAGVDGRSFQTTNILLFAVADNTEGISCKAFFKDTEGYEKVLGRLKKAAKGGGVIKIKGSVRYDKYDNDYVMFADSVLLVDVESRKDNAEEKRVELHCHTTMSNMDAVSSAKKLITTAEKWGWPAIAITDHGVVQAFPEAMETVFGRKPLNIKVVYGVEGYLVGEDYEQKRANHIILLAKNPNGLRNLYKLITMSHLRFFHRTPRLPRQLIQEYREGLIIGSACEAGELIRAIVAGQSHEELLKIADFYDYLEIQPIGNNEFLVRSEDFPNIKDDNDLININLKVAELAKQLNKPLIATCDVHFLNPEDQIYRAILMKGKGFKDADFQPPLFLRTTEEMLAEFQYLGEEAAYEAVVTNPRKIAEMCEKFKPIPDELYSPMIPGADEEITSMTYNKAKSLYGEVLPKIVQDRIDQELKPIIAHGFSVLYLIAQRLVRKSNLDGYLVGSRGSVGSSFVATMTDITEVNPLPPHWRCPHCKHSEFITDGSYGCGYDLPDKSCPICGTNMIKDGHEIPFAVFLGFDGDKVPDIDLNFSGEYQPVAHKYTEELFGKDNVFRAGSIGTVAEKTAYGFVRKYFEEKGQTKREAYINKVAIGCNGVKRTTGQHPAGIMVVPRDMDVHFFTPLQHPADDTTSATITTHFDYHSISSRLVKLDILGHDDPTVIKMLEDLTHRDPKTIPFDDPATLSLFNCTNALGVTEEELGANSGTFGIPEFRTNFTRQMIADTNPSCFSDLVRISGFSHGTDVWLGNAQDLIRAGTCTLQNAIAARDDIMMYLMHNGVEPLLAFKTMERVRKGKGIEPDVVETLRKTGIPEWYIESCQKIKYMFPRAHATAYVMMAYRIAFCKVHYPLAYYAAYFSIRAAAFDSDIIARGQKAVKEKMEELEAKDKRDAKEDELYVVLQLAWEMYIRGFKVKKVDLYKSGADRFQMVTEENALLPPFTTLTGLGGVDAKSIVEKRKTGPFSSIENLKKRTGITKTSVEALRVHGCLEGMDESDQMSLF
ncbi:DNA polymerase III subunit alpha [Anaerovibrio lipolyticus]|uniref:DNA polymerase III PolC-type n=1 Tax=Anaerovibrio lipolyticus TaxID=82374 RepID=A0A0B2JTY0_9FIRM|nr:PolC-type DNA polymerase III [Anaerovibrio lipolyticus]KHM51760.1 DNA polymerase III subunit alpha [Anaerovibrio lipolyticus]